jgi:hypothetical protein
MTPDEQKAVKDLVTEAQKRVWEGIHEGDATKHLEWLGKQDSNIVKLAVIATQPRGWNQVIHPLVEDMSEEKRAGFLAALIAVFVQAQAATNSQSKVG